MSWWFTEIIISISDFLDYFVMEVGAKIHPGQSSLTREKTSFQLIEIITLC
jgi:hypothetical protein